MTYSERGGIRIGKSYFVGIRASWPLAKITVTHEKIILNFLWKKIEF